VVEQLDCLVDEIEARHSKLILLIADGGLSQSFLLRELAQRRGATVLNIGSELGARLAELPVKQRALAVPVVLRELADRRAANGLVLLDNIELLFDRSLRLEPLDLLKQLARTRRVVVVWPGQLREGRLIYAETGHPEHQDCNISGLVIFKI
jgi:hypothetical protein